MPAGADPLLDLEVERLELLAELRARGEDVAGGLAPVWARRSLYPHELRARVSFAAIADAVDVAASGIGRRLAEDRARMLAAMTSWLADAPNAAVIAGRLADVQTRGLGLIPGAAGIIDAADRAFVDELDRLARQGAARAAAEAIAQGVDVAGGFVLDEAAAAHLQAAARRLAVAPHQELVAALQAEAARLGPGTPAAIVQRLQEAGAGLAQGPLDLAGRNAASSADGIGRQAVALADPGGLRPRFVYASEILDGSTCGPCSLVDGHEYGSIELARLDYPAGIYRACEGGPRCRGTLVFVWADEAEPTLQSPFGG